MPFLAKPTRTLRAILGNPMSKIQFVNLLQGTDSNMGLSKGGTEPLMAMPFGMAHWMPQTDDFWGWQFRPASPNLLGIRLTHQPSPWMGDYGAFLITPLRVAKWSVKDAELHPNRMRIQIAETGVTIDGAPTERGAIFRFGFPDGAPAKLVLKGIIGETHFEVLPDRKSVVGWTRGNNGGVPKNFACYLVAEFEQPITSSSSVGASDISLEFGRPRNVVMRVGTSFISVEQAKLNLNREMGHASIEEIAHRAERAWEHTLSQIEVSTEDEKHLSTFYSCLYRTKLFPRQWHEIDANGTQLHFSPYDGTVHKGPLYADTGFWDTFRTQHPLMLILEPTRQAEMLQGFVGAYHESGWLPQWPSPGHRVSMPGTHMDVTIADAISKGVRDFDVEAALKGMLQHADPPNHGGPVGAGRNDLQHYLDLGYSVGNGAVAQTLDYAFDDWAISEVATFLNRQDVAERMRKRAGNWRNLYDPSVGLMRAKKEDGEWVEPFDPLAWGGPYVEGGPWQSSWAVQHDPAGLMMVMGGEKAFAEKIDTMLSMTSDFHVGGYGTVIHEMTEMKIAPFGQYAHSNQPVHHVLFLYLIAGRPWRCQKEVRRVMELMYSPDAFSGDEDNGEMAAWYVLSALGIYPLCPGRPEWVISSPLFKKATVHLPNGRALIVDAPDNSAENIYVESVSLNGHLLNGPVLSHESLLNGGNLHFHMVAEPNTRITPISFRPASMSRYA